MPRVVYGSTKTYTHNVGLSCCFRQWKATSHCNKLHGYALQVEVEFEALRLDERNWVVDFGGLKAFKHFLEATFDHTCVVAVDDPKIPEFEALDAKGIIDMIVLPAVGCEYFSTYIFSWLEQWLDSQPEYRGRARVLKVAVREHQGNSGYTRAANVI